MARQSKITSEQNSEGLSKSGNQLSALTGISFLTQPERIFDANDRVRLAVCDIRGQGFTHAEEYSRFPNVEVAAVCEVDEKISVFTVTHGKFPNAETIARAKKLGGCIRLSTCLALF